MWGLIILLIAGGLIILFLLLVIFGALRMSGEMSRQEEERENSHKEDL